ncbi:alanine racemase [Alkalihalobacillus pseudalcaliphilus]|uniref:alanine racemase n=1 Tax=Alkalihalobacillus pseudalcaliphilus TaxID=79884 RepID=UPI000AEC3326|nr:alanine racemase [Alkalihalobacillus pseudalcaliphilus]
MEHPFVTTKTPELLLDLDAFEHNTKMIAKQAFGKKIRIASKSIRSLELLRYILDSDDVFQGVMCYTAEEALFLYENNITDIIIGYPTTDQLRLSKIAQVHGEAKIFVMIDSIHHVNELEDLAKAVNGRFYVLVDIDMSTQFPALHFGVRRSPLQQCEEVLGVAFAIRQSQNLQFCGIMGYEAQIAGVPDFVRGKSLTNKLIQTLKKVSMPQIEKRRKRIVTCLEDHGFICRIVNGGGTGSLSHTVCEEVITEVTVGSGFYAPVLFDHYRDFQYNPALFFSLPIVRQAGKHLYTCLGGGYIASGSVGVDKQPLLIYPPGASLTKLEGAGEVQTPIHYLGTLHIGDSVLFRAAKAGEICERFDNIIGQRNGEVEQSFLTYRGEGVCFL